MRNPNAQYVARLTNSNRDLVDVVEFYSPAAASIAPSLASKLFAESEITWNAQTYQQQYKGRSDAKSFITDKFDSVTVKLSNIDGTVGAWLNSTSIKGYRLVIRRISRSVDTYSNVLFVGRCEQPDEIGNVEISITAKQYLGNIDISLPWATVQSKCGIAFKGTECLGGQTLGSKSAAYQAATNCNKVYEGDCSTYANTDMHQGQRYKSLTGNFKLKVKVLKVITKKATKQWSSADGSAYGKPVPFGVGRTQVSLLPLVYADTGQYIAGQSLIGEGPLTAILNCRNVSDGFATTFQFLDTHLGEYGANAEQTPTGFFASAATKNSHRGYIEYTIQGNNPDTGDPAPDIWAVILWPAIPSWNGTNFSTSKFTVNPVDALRYVITEPRGIGYSSTWINDTISGATADYCNSAVNDTSGGSDLYLSNEVTANGGVDLLRYRGSGIYDTFYFRSLLGLDSTPSQTQQASYNYFNPASPGTPTAGTYYKARYTCNFHVTERIKASELIFKKILPSFRGFLVTDETGKLAIKCKRPQLTQYLRASTSVGATQLAVEDVDAWKALAVPKLYCLVDVWTSEAETAEVASATYSTVGNSITLARTVTGTITATLSGATLSGGSTSVAASGTVTIGGTITAGNVATITIDGVASSYTIKSNDTTGTIAGMLATIINSNTTINRYVRAEWSTSTPTVITIKSKLGFLNLASGLVYAHATSDEVMHVHGVFTARAGGANTRGNILRGSFKPLNNHEQAYNQFKIKYQDAKADFAETELNEIDYDRQATTNEPIIYEIDGSCVDDYDQASRLVQAARWEFGEDKTFYYLESVGLAECLEVSDVICVNHPSIASTPNVPAIVEDLAHKEDTSVAITARRYRKEMFPDTALATTIALETPVTWVTNAPGTPTGLALTTPSNGTIRGTFAFAVYPGTQEGIVQVKKAGSGSFVDVGERVKPDASNNGVFEIAGLPGGSTDVKILPVSGLGTQGTATAAVTITITGTNGTVYTFASPSLTWTINHNLGYNPRTVLFDSSGSEITGNVTNPTVNQTVVTWNVAQAGSARLY